MTVDDSLLSAPPSPIVKHSPSDNILSRARSHSSAASRHVPLDYFARRDTEPVFEQADGGGSVTETPSIATTLAEGSEFRFDKFLQEKWDRAAEEGINSRETGVVFKDLKVVGLGADAKYQDTILSMLNPLNLMHVIQNIRHPPVKDILSGFEGVVRPGEMLLVLGRPGSGCTSLLKVLANQRQGFHAVEGELSYDGITPEYMAKHYRGDIGYSPEDDVHFPSLTVRQTLNVSSASRTPRTRIDGISRKEHVDTVVDTLGTVFGLTHTFNTPVGDENIRGVSGGEKKRVSIAEMMSTHVRLACWDNSTRGLDASTALEFTRALRIATDIAKVTTIVSIYQASENIYQHFDKVAVIDEGRLSYFGPADQARDYFMDMGYEPANRQTTADFLVGVTHGPSRTPRRGFESRVPKTPAEFAKYFANSALGRKNHQEVNSQLYDTSFDEKVLSYKASARAERAKHMPPGSPYTISLAMQARILMRRRVQIIRGDLTTQGIMLFNFIAQGLIMGSVFFKMPDATSAYFSRGGTLFFAVLFGALSSMAEIPALYTQRPIVQRHHRAALYHPFIDSLALTLVDIPITAVTMVVFGILLYFMTDLQRHASNFFIFLLFIFSVSLTMKAFFRGLAASFSQEAQAQALAGLGTLVLVIYTGFTIPRPSMIGALKWLTFINPMKYGFEALIANEFHGLDGTCSSLVPSGPGYENVTLVNQVCTTLGAQQGSSTVNGDRFISLNYGYSYSNLWRNFGITMLFWFAFLAWFFYRTERGDASSGSATQLIFRRGAKIPKTIDSSRDEEKGLSASSSLRDSEMIRDVRKEDETKDALPPPRGVFSWHNLNYDIQLAGGKQRRLLDDVSGYVAPGKLTALMGESGAGKTTLLNALAERLRVGVITGDRFVNGSPLPADFAGQTGYCQQMDIHLETATVREALRFSAILRQPATVSRREKYDYVEEVIRMCEMEAYADAVVGHVGEGLNVEQRKRLTIGVELAAKPQLLLFLDEPTSGLSSQSAWAIIEFLRSLADRGQAILCTIHQPSAELFQAFDRLLLLRKGGQTCYFGDLGNHATTLINYFERNGGRKCKEEENPAEYMLDVIGAGATAHSSIDWHAVWTESSERKDMESQLQGILRKDKEAPAVRTRCQSEFAASITVQFVELIRRAFQNYLRNPTYLLSKYTINIFAGLFIGFTFFKAKNNLQGAQNHIFAVFMGTILAVPHSNMLQVPFLRFRQIYETRERSSKMYHWFPLVTTSLLVEIPFNILGSSLYFFCWYWTVGFPGSANRVGYQYLNYGVMFPLFYTTFSQAVAAASPNAQIAGLIFSFLFSFIITFNGVLQPFSQLVPFWHWMYRLSPFTYLIESLVTNGLGNQEIRCSSTEIVTLTPPAGFTCQDYMSSFINARGGYLLNPNDVANCQFCSTSLSDSYLATLNMFFSHRWRNVGFLAAYIFFNVFLLYLSIYLFRIRTGNPFRSIISRFRRTKP
ncbi:pleiotropic drug resistance ABC transporter [Ramaria rubella]|nr:pleiotropic drug resistance ABC transporter [Ramaria rubella]